jgi:ribosome-binding protein aMBF1 (putative translation factor)
MKIRAATFTPGQWNAVCDRCGTTHKNVDLRQEWTGLRVCSDCYDPRHPQDYLRGKADHQAPPWTRPKPPEKDVSPGSGNEVSADDL